MQRHGGCGEMKMEEPTKPYGEIGFPERLSATASVQEMQAYHENHKNWLKSINGLEGVRGRRIDDEEEDYQRAHSFDRAMYRLVDDTNGLAKALREEVLFAVAIINTKYGVDISQDAKRLENLTSIVSKNMEA